MVPILSAALLPILLLLAFILLKDREQPEPPGQLLKAFAFGVLSVIPALLFVWLLRRVGVVPEEVQTLWGAVLKSFCAAAIPEELAKLLMLWLALRKNPFFDEHMDGIVYAVCVSLGFAATENVFYLISNAEQYMRVGIVRALFAVPGHFCDGVLMGYYYSLAVFAIHSRRRYRFFIILAPVLAHGVYDSFLFAARVSEGYRSALCLAFLAFCYLLWRLASRRIREHLVADGVIHL